MHFLDSLILFIICFNNERKDVQGEEGAALVFLQQNRYASDCSPLGKEYISILQHWQDKIYKIS